jgi:hypothetical protein
MAADSWGLSWKGTTGYWLASWASTFVPPTPQPEGMKPAGRSKRKRSFVEIDGQQFEVRNAQHARALLERAREVAVTHAKELAAEIVAREANRKSTKPVRLPTPSITTEAPELQEVVREARKSFNELYRSTAIDTELALLLARKLADEDEEDALLLLL